MSACMPTAVCSSDKYMELVTAAVVASFICPRRRV
jgi:hypothetical protein